ncbi:MAG: nucleotide excision repair endonuclease [Fibrobacter sp.]|jgi:hypothetical protein|nr:nucleotide excision repair endonuclease [Fibrobacter sp.]
MLEQIIKHLEQHPDGVSSLELAKEFLKFKDTQSSFAHLTISSILSKNKRVYMDDDGRWHIKDNSSSCKSLEQLPLTATFIIGDTGTKNRYIHYVSLWKIFPEPQHLYGEWTVDDDFLQTIGRKELRSIYDHPFSASGWQQNLLDAVSHLRLTVPVYLCASHHNLLKSTVAALGVSLTDDSIHMCELFQCAGIEIDDPENLNCCYKALFGKTCNDQNAFRQSQVFAECIRELVRILLERGIYSREDMDDLLKESRKSLISGKEFSYDQICDLPSDRGVFGFKDKNGKFLYIGKTDNLKRKIISFFRDNNTNSAKLQYLQEYSHSLITHQCASELEALLFEHRLVLKHSPQLNSKKDLSQGKDPIAKIEDCVIVMSHTRTDLLMTFWFCRNKRIKIKSIDLKHSEKLNAELEDFFNLDIKSTESSDPVEMSLACNWIHRNKEQLLMVPINETRDGSEILESIKFYWNLRLNN